MGPVRAMRSGPRIATACRSRLHRVPGDGENAAGGLWASITVLLRRWPVVVIGLLLTGAAAYGVYKVVPVTYTATGSLLLDVPDPPVATPGTTVFVNPVIGSKPYVGDLVSTLMADPSAQEGVLERGGSGTFTTSIGLGEAALVQISTKGDTPSEAIDTWNAAAKETESQLLQLQEEKGAPDDQLVTISPITAPVDAVKESGSRMRAVVVTIVVGVVLTLLLAFAVESLSQFRASRRRKVRRSRRRKDKAEGVKAADGGPVGAPAHDFVTAEAATSDISVPDLGSGLRDLGPVDPSPEVASAPLPRPVWAEPGTRSTSVS